MDLASRFDSVLDKHLLSWLEEYPWTRLEIALTWLTLLQCDSGSIRAPWWQNISSSSSCNNPGISWLWNLRCGTTSEKQFVCFFRDFLECPERCCHLSIGEASTTDNFVHLCGKIVLNSCLGSPNLLNLRYFFFVSC